MMRLQSCMTKRLSSYFHEIRSLSLAHQSCFKIDSKKSQNKHDNEYKSNSKSNLALYGLKIVSSIGMLAWLYQKLRNSSTNQKSTKRTELVNSLVSIFGECSAKSSDLLSDKERMLKFSRKSDNSQQEIGSLEDTNGKISFETAIAKSRQLCLRRKIEVGSPGIAVCVSVDGQQVYAEGFGYADLENLVLMRPDSVMRIASISKAITAAITAKLWEKGDIDLSKPVQHYVPEFPEKEFLGEKVTITVGQILNHTSGIRHYKSDDDPVTIFDKPLDDLLHKINESINMLFYKAGPPVATKQSSKDSSDVSEKKEKEVSEMERKEYLITAKFNTTKEALALFDKDPLEAKPGSKFLYTTFGYTLMAAVVEAATKEQFTTTVNKTLKHFGMKESYLDKHDPIIYNRARYYKMDKRGMLVNTPYVDLSYKWAGGGLLSTTQDVVKFGNILLYCAQHKDTDDGLPGYLKLTTIKKFWHPTGEKGRMSTYGLGFELTPGKEQYGLCDSLNFGAGHTGAAVGASSAMFILPSSYNGQDMTKEIYNTCSDVKPDGTTMDSSTPESNSTQQKNRSLPQGVVVAVFINMEGVPARDIAEKIARLFENVDFQVEDNIVEIKRSKKEKKKSKRGYMKVKDKDKKDESKIPIIETEVLHRTEKECW